MLKRNFFQYGNFSANNFPTHKNKKEKENLGLVRKKKKY